jgi:lipopolysaccharide transport system permease protein
MFQEKVKLVLEDTNSIPAQKPRLRVQPSRGWMRVNFAELSEYRELLYFLTWRDIKVRYKQTVIGAAWAIIQPLLTMLVFSVFFGRLADVPSDGIPYPIFSYTALVPWTFFANGLIGATNSLVTNSNLIKKVYFPRLLIPASAIASNIVDFVLAFAVLLVMMVFYGIVPTANIIWLPLFIVLAGVTSLGVGLWFAAMNVQFRDVRYVIPFLVQFWLFATPVAYPSSLIENDLLRALYGINPMVGVIEGFRWSLLGTGSAPQAAILVSSLIAILLCLTGLYYFKRLERTFADVI